MTIDEARAEALRRWPWNQSMGDRFNRAGGVRHGVLLAVGIAAYDLEYGYPHHQAGARFEVKGWGRTWEEAFSFADKI